MATAAATQRLSNSLTQLRSSLNRRMNPGISTTAADVARHARIDVFIRRVRDVVEQRSRAHHLACLAVATLWHVVLEPCLLYGVVSVFGQAFDRCNRAVAGGNCLYCHLARAHRYAVNVDGASPTLADATTKFGADIAELVADGPEEWRFRIDVYLVGFAVYG